MWAGDVECTNRIRRGGLGVLPMYVLGGMASDVKGYEEVFDLRSSAWGPDALQQVACVESRKVVV